MTAEATGEALLPKEIETIPDYGTGSSPAAAAARTDNERGHPTAAARLLAIEGARTILTFGIISFHVHTFVAPLAPPGSYLEVLINRVGDVAVTFFFVASGFLARLRESKHPAGLHACSAFVLRRFLRLAPAYYLSLLLCYLLLLVTRIIPSAANLFTNPWSSPIRPLQPWALLSELLMLQSWLTLRNVPGAIPNGEADRVEFFEYGVNPADWFVSALLGCVALHAAFGGLLASSLLISAWRSLAAALGFCSLRALTFYLQAVQNESVPSSHLRFDFLWHWVPAASLGYFAGVSTASLFNALPAEGAIRCSRLWLVADIMLLARCGDFGHRIWDPMSVRLLRANLHVNCSPLLLHRLSRARAASFCYAQCSRTQRIAWPSTSRPPWAGAHSALLARASTTD